MQFGGFIALMSAGIFAGFLYETICVVKKLFCNRIWVVVFCDFIFAVLAGGLFAIVEYKYLNFQIFGFGVAAFVSGIFVERISLGFLLAKTYSYIYNKVKELAKKYANTKFGKKTLK